MLRYWLDFHIRAVRINCAGRTLSYFISKGFIITLRAPPPDMHIISWCTRMKPCFELRVEATQLPVCLCCLFCLSSWWFHESEAEKDFVVLGQLSRCARLSAAPWPAALQASLSFTISWSVLKLMTTDSVMPPNHLVLCHPLLHLPSIFASIRVFSWCSK